MSLTTERRTRWSMLPAVLASLLIASCSGDAEPPASVESPSAETAPTTLAISADLFNGSVSFFDLDALVASDGTRDSALVERLQLAPADQQGPLTMAITAAGTRAVVLLSQGVLAFVGERLGVDTDTLPNTGSGVVILDLTTRQVLAEFPTDDLPIMVAIDERLGHAFVSLFGEAETNGSVAVYDLAALEEVERVEVAPFVEGLALNDAGTRGAVIGATAGLYLFDPADLSGSLSDTPLRLADDSSGVAFISGTNRVVVANSRNPSNYVVVVASAREEPLRRSVRV